MSLLTFGVSSASRLESKVARRIPGCAMSDGMEWSGGLADPNPNENPEVQEGQTGSDWLAAAARLAGPKP